MPLLCQLLVVSLQLDVYNLWLRKEVFIQLGRVGLNGHSRPKIQQNRAKQESAHRKLLFVTRDARVTALLLPLQ